MLFCDYDLITLALILYYITTLLILVYYIWET